MEIQSPGSCAAVCSPPSGANWPRCRYLEGQKSKSIRCWTRKSECFWRYAVAKHGKQYSDHNGGHDRPTMETSSKWVTVWRNRNLKGRKRWRPSPLMRIGPSGFSSASFILLKHLARYCPCCDATCQRNKQVKPWTRAYRSIQSVVLKLLNQLKLWRRIKHHLSSCR